jgi:hypothetical protein
VHPAHDKLGDFLAFPLRSHVAGAVDSRKVESLVTDNEAGDLTIGVPRGPGLLDGPVKLLNPSASAIGWDGTVSVSRVEENLIAVLL